MEHQIEPSGNNGKLIDMEYPSHDLLEEEIENKVKEKVNTAMKLFDSRIVDLENDLRCSRKNTEKERIERLEKTIRKLRVSLKLLIVIVFVSQLCMGYYVYQRSLPDLQRNKYHYDSAHNIETAKGIDIFTNKSFNYGYVKMTDSWKDHAEMNKPKIRTIRGNFGSKDEYEVFLTVQQLDTENESNQRWALTVEKKDNEFEIKLETWATSKVYSLDIKWLVFRIK